MTNVATVVRRVKRCCKLRAMGEARLIVLAGRLDKKRNTSPRAWICAWLAECVLRDVQNERHEKYLKNTLDGRNKRP